MGVYPSMTDLVRDFDRVASRPGFGTESIRVGSQEELSHQLEEEAKDKDGPLLILSGHGRVRLMGLKVTPEKPVIPENKTPALP
jgi:hypothetical protein